MSSEQKLIRECKKYKRRAQEKIYKKHSPVFRAICIRYARNYSDADDILHDSFIKIFTKINQYKEKGSFEGWMKRIIVNTALSYYNDKIKSKETELIPNQSPDKDNEENEEQEESVKTYVLDGVLTEEEIVKTVNKLPDGYRIVFNLFIFEKYSHKEIAKKLNIKVSSSKSQLTRARKLLKNKLEELVKRKK